MKPSNPFQPPDEWIEILLKLPDLERPRIIVSLSAGRGGYKGIIDTTPEVSRVVSDEGDPAKDIITVHLGADFVPGDCRDAAETLYSEACKTFLEARRADGSSFIRSGRIRLQLFEGQTETGVHALEVTREAFGETDDVVVQSSGAAGDALRIVADHSKNVGSQFISLSRLAGEQAAAERSGVLEYARGALELTKEAGEIRAAAMAQLASATDNGFMHTEAGQALAFVMIEQIPRGFDLLDKFLDVKRETAKARRAEAEAARERSDGARTQSASGRKRRGDK